MKTKRNVQVNFRASPAEYARWCRAAKRDLRSLSSWVRFVLERAAAETAHPRPKGPIR